MDATINKDSPDDRCGDGARRRHRRHAVRPGSGQFRLLCLSGGKIGGHRRADVPAGQDLSDQRLRHVNHLAQTGRGRPASEHRILDPYRTFGARTAKPGHFTARVRQQPRFVDLDKCTSCGECAKVCPIEFTERIRRRAFQTEGRLQAVRPGHPGRLTPSANGAPPPAGRPARRT